MKLYAPIKVILADDHELYRDGFSAMLKKQDDIELAGEAGNGEELIRLTRLLQPDIIVADIVMPGINGIAATKTILNEFPHIGVIALSMSNEDSLLMQMIEAGAKGYLLKNSHSTEIIEAIKTVYKNGSYYCKNSTAKITKLLSNKPLFSETETSIIILICQGFSSQEIAQQLKYSIHTIDSYRKKILEKMNVKNVSGIIMFAIRNGIFKPGENEL